MRPAASIAGSAPSKWAPIPWIAVKMIRMKPIPADEAHTCCGANGRGFLLENDHMEKAGADWIPIRANM